MQLDWGPDAERGLELFNSGEFYACHDVWEEVWMTKSGAERTFYQGLIQLAVAMFKAAQGNHAGTRSLLRKGIAKLQSVPEVVSPLDIDLLLVDAERLLSRIEELGPARLSELGNDEFLRIRRVGKPPGALGEGASSGPTGG